MRQDGVDAVMGRGPDTELREKTDRHAETLLLREAAFSDPSAANQSPAASHPHPSWLLRHPWPHPDPVDRLYTRPHSDPLWSLASHSPPPHPI